MSIKVLTRCRCDNTHTNIHSYVHCAFRHSRITGTGKFALITRCGLTCVHQHMTEAEAHAAKAELDANTCAGICRGSHEVVQLSPNPNHPTPKNRTTPTEQDQNK